MYNCRTEQLLSAALDGPIVVALVNAIRESYDVVAVRFHDPAEGCDAQSFGFMVWKVLENRIKRLAGERKELGIRIVPSANAFRFGVGGFKFGIHSVGQVSVGTLDDSFPNNHCAAGQLALDNAQQLLNLGYDAYVPRSFVFAHLGNSEVGCEQVWVAEPAQEFRGGISGWGVRRELWRLDTDASFEMPTVTLPRAVDPRPIEVTLKEQANINSPTA